MLGKNNRKICAWGFHFLNMREIIMMMSESGSRSMMIILLYLFITTINATMKMIDRKSSSLLFVFYF